jgi:sugar-specific transcriptional regulator TrmB
MRYTMPMIRELQDFGLSDNEARVYVAALEIGRATADQLSKHSKVKRSTTYVQLDSLMEKGLMSTYEEGNRTYFAPESPELLKRMLLKQKDELQTKERDLSNLLPELLRQFEGAGERPVVRFYGGKEGITVLREKVLKAKRKEVLVVSNTDAFESVFSESERFSYSKNRVDSGLSVKLLYARKYGMFQDPPQPKTQRRYLSPETLSIQTDLTVFDDYVAMVSLRGSLFGVLIQSKEIATSIQSIFDILWSVGAEDRR